MKTNYSEFNAEDRVTTKLLEHHKHVLMGEVDAASIKTAMEWVIYSNLDVKGDSWKTVPITLYINSEGGSLQDAFALIDIMNASVRPVRTIGLGSVMSAAFLIFVSGTVGERYIGHNTSIMCHQYSWDVTGKHHDLTSAMKEGEVTNQRMLEVLRSSQADSFEEKYDVSSLLGPTDVYIQKEDLFKAGLADHAWPSLRVRNI